MAWIVQQGKPWTWVFLVLAATSTVGALLRGNWRWAIHPLLWGAGIGWTLLNHEEFRSGDPQRLNGWAVFFGLLGASMILGFAIDRIPRRRRRTPDAPPRPGAGDILDTQGRVRE